MPDKKEECHIKLNPLKLLRQLAGKEPLTTDFTENLGLWSKKLQVRKKAIENHINNEKYKQQERNRARVGGHDEQGMEVNGDRKEPSKKEPIVR